MKKIIISFMICCFLVGCASEKVDKDFQRTKDWSVERLYNEANGELNSGNYRKAIKLYDILRSNYPYGKFDQQSYLDTAYAYYLDEEKDNALKILSEFEKKYPSHPDNDYVLYLKGLILFNEYKSFLDKLSSQDWSERDIRANNQTYEIFMQLINQYPNSQYISVAKKRVAEIVEALGGHEIAVARYYMERGAYVAAINRAKNIILDYGNTEFSEEALAIIMSAYLKLDQTKLSDDFRRILELNYPKSDFLKYGWYNKNYIPWWQLGHWNFFNSNKKQHHK